MTHSGKVQRRQHPRTSSQANFEISHDAFGSMTLKAKNASLGGFLALRGAHVGEKGMALEFV